MKKLINISIIGILIISGFGVIAISEKNLEKIETTTIYISEPTIINNENYVTIELTDTKNNFIESGKPAIPMITKTYTFPFGTKIKNVEVTYGTESNYEIKKPINIAPEPQIKSTIYQTSNKFSEETPTYDDIDIYPEQSYSYRTGAGLKNREHVIFVTVNFCNS